MRFEQMIALMLKVTNRLHLHFTKAELNIKCTALILALASGLFLIYTRF